MNAKTQTHNPRLTEGATRRRLWQWGRTTCLAAGIVAFGVTTAVRADRVDHQVSAGLIEIINPIRGYYNNNNTTARLMIGVNGLSVVTNVVNMGDYRVQIGDDQSDDVANGVLMVAVAQNGRANWTNANNTLTNNYQTPCAIPYAGGYWEAGIFRCPPISSTTANQGEDDVNVGVAYFPYSKFLGGTVLNGANGEELTNFTGSAGLVLGTHFMDYLTNSAVSDAVKNGVYYLDLRSFGIDSRRDGVLLVNHAKNEANYALSRVNNDDNEMDGTWTLYTHDNRANAGSYEQDPICFVFIPKSDTSVVSGMFMGDGSISIFSGATPAFNVTWRTDLGNGQYELKIPGYSPKNGVLVISAAGGDSYNFDNIVTYAPNAAGDGWMIQSRDLPACGLQSPPETEPVCSFVFVPAEKPGITATPSRNLMTTEKGDTAQFTVTLNGYPRPTANVTINLSSSDLTEGTVSPSTLTLTPADWNVPQIVTITGVDDAIVDGTQPYTIDIANTISSDPNYSGLAVGSVGVINIDDEPGISVDASRITTTEAGGTATFNVWLNTMPTANVTLALSSSDTTEATVSPASLIFTPADYATPQIVTVTGVDDLVQDGPATYFVITAAATSDDPAYNGFNALDVQGENLDDDIAGIIVPSGKVRVMEPNSTAAVPLVLRSEPTANVTIHCVSTDTSEGTVTPSVTFTPANWNVPQNITITAVDDFENDGTIEFTIITTVSSSDPVYVAIKPDDIKVETLDNEADLQLPSGDFVYGIGEAAKGIDGYVTISDPDTADYKGGNLTVTITAGGSGADRLEVRNDGSGPGQIGVAGNTISYEGAAIGTKSGGSGGAPLNVAFNSTAATPAAAQALLRAVTYQNVDANAAPSSRALSFTLADGHSGVSTMPKTITLRLMRVDSYQQGADGGWGEYADALDTQTHHLLPDTPLPIGFSEKGLWIDFDTGSLIPTDQPQAFVKFQNIFGSDRGQIPLGSKIVFAELVMNVADSGHGARFNRMLGDWDETVTFNSLGAGIQLDDVEAVSGTNSFLGDEKHNTTTGTGLRTIGVTSDVQAWSDGAANYGWVMSVWEGGENGTAFSPCEATNVLWRPRLRVGWIPAAKTSVAVFQQGSGGYAGTVDTQVRLVAPDTSYATATVLGPDPLSAATPIPNPNQVLLRFDNIIGSEPGQVPEYATIHAAVVEFTSISADAQGAGAQFHAMMKSWTDADTWNTLVNGLSNDGIEAAIQPTKTLPAEGFGEQVQPTRHTVELTADVQAWANGSMRNNGWALLPWPEGSNAWMFNSAEEPRVDTRPQLRVYYTASEVIKLGIPVHNGSRVELRFSGVSGNTYYVDRKGAIDGAWSQIGSVTLSESNGAFTDNAPLAGSAFYRIRRPLP